MAKRRKARTVYRTRYKKSRMRSTGGLGGLIKPIVTGTIGGIVAPMIPLLNTMPFNGAIGGAGASYLMGGKSMKNMLIAGASGHFIPRLLGLAGNVATTNNLFDGVTQ